MNFRYWKNTPAHAHTQYGIPTTHFADTFCTGEKKKLRKERIAVKRRERMQHRGVDLEKINSVRISSPNIVISGFWPYYI